MKKIFTLLAAFALTTIAFGQVTVTYQVDITNYLAAGNTLNAAGIRIGGNFTTNGATNAEWTPSDPSNAMTDLGNNLWSIDVTYPQASIGMTQQYKFVNGDWGTNEGTDPANTIGAGGCGSDDGSGNVNRLLTIPSANTTVTFCWDACTACNLGLEDNATSLVAVSPNPAKTSVNFELTSSDATIMLFDLSGKVISTTTATSTLVNVSLEGLQAGTYIYQVNAGDAVATGKLVKE